MVRLPLFFLRITYKTLDEEGSCVLGFLKICVIESNTDLRTVKVLVLSDKKVLTMESTHRKC